MLDEHPSLTRTPDEAPTTPLTIERVIPPEPHFGAGTYEVRLELSRPMTCFEAQALHSLRHGLQPAGRILTVCDTTLERVAEEAGTLSALVRDAEEAGRRRHQEARLRALREAAMQAQEAARLAAVADSIRFPH
jgi:hypothetical protein